MSSTFSRLVLLSFNLEPLKGRKQKPPFRFSDLPTDSVDMKLGALVALAALSLLVVMTGKSEGRMISACDLKAELRKELTTMSKAVRLDTGKVPISAPVEASVSI